MTDDWRPGDLALCVRKPIKHGAGGLTAPGRLYTVAAVCRDDYGSTVLDLEGVAFEGPDFLGHLAWRFRKIRPLSDEEREEALRELREPVKELVQ